MRSPLPSLDGVGTWLNGDAPSEESLAGKPVLVHFWSVSCYICHDVAKQVAEWRDRFGPLGLEVIAIHQPRGPEELDHARVGADARGEMGLSQPCALDDEHTLVDRFQNQFVPAYYVFNRNHELRHFQAGDKGYDRIVTAIERVLTDEEQAA
ncbi:MAG: TlpA family protein disulfide reductase [Candidatus Eremiobacteraeota bacterium]|nr:TlpA family protein disulfide reductase [Candidatus Eremiobacteraeota bacterium]